ncbi:MAG: SLC13 family permease [Anaerolineae bacterium]|nr:SLC13 family permease [Anaerolineae bacterium]
MSLQMNFQAILTLGILIATLAVLASRRLRPDLTAVCATLALVLTGVLEPGEAFSAFGEPVIVIVACVYILGTALYETGVATLISERLMRYSHRGTGFLLLVLMLTAGLLSAVLSSLLVIVILMPAVQRLCRKTKMAPAQFLLPVVIGASMGNLLTLIGTVSNLVVDELLATAGQVSLSFLSLAPVGLASLALAIAWYVLVGHRLLPRAVTTEPEQPSLEEVAEDYQLKEELYRLRVRTDSDLVGLRLGQTDLSSRYGLNVLAIQVGGKPLRVPDPVRPLEHDDVLIVEGKPGTAYQAATIHELEPKGRVELEELSGLEAARLALAELMVPIRSQLSDKSLAEVRFRDRYGLNILAVRRRGRIIRQNLRQVILRTGDTLLVQGPAERLKRVGYDLNLVLVNQLGPQPGDRVTAKARLTVGILLAMIVAVVAGILPLATASLAAAIALILTGSVRVERAYRSIDGSILILVGAMLPMAMALEKTGAAAAIAGRLAALSGIVGPLGTLGLLFLFAALVTQIVSNSAAAALVTPLAISLANAQGLPPQPFAIAMAVAVTTSYLTPLTNTDNLLVREAGTYTMRHYVINGLPLFVIQLAFVLVLSWFSGVR